MNSVCCIDLFKKAIRAKTQARFSTEPVYIVLRDDQNNKIPQIRRFHGEKPALLTMGS